MPDETNWTAYGLVETALEDALVGHGISWREVRSAALKAVAFIDDRMALETPPEAGREASST